MAETSISPKIWSQVRGLLILFPALGLAAGFAIRPLGLAGWSGFVWAAFTLPVLLTLIYEIVSSLRRGDVGLDIVAAVSMSAAIVFGEQLAAVVVALMYAGGQYLESFAERHARREMTELLSRMPRSAMRYRNGRLEEVELDEITPGDQLLVRQGDVVPVDGTVAGGVAVLDQSALTGESIPVQRRRDETVMSGSTNSGEAFDLFASRRAAESTYAGILRLVEMAQSSKAPMSRLADRFAMVFLAATLVIASAAYFLTGDPIRAVAVLVVATPCPLILAVPVAIVSGLSRAARHGILIKGGKVLETIARIKSVVLDKTGTLTEGRARIVSINAWQGLSPNEALRLAASLEQASKHVTAKTIVSEAQGRGLQLAVPTHIVETPGEGIEGRVESRALTVGGPHFVASKLTHCAATAAPAAPGAMIVAVAMDGKLVARLVLADELRSGAREVLHDLKALGLERIVLATGDRREVAEAITAGLPIDQVRSELSPEQKVMVVLSERKHGPVMMVGDGINDAPALAAADVGVAMGARGTAASVEAADAVILVDQLDRLLPAITIARRSLTIARESVLAGIGLSVAGMMLATFGHITPVQGALFQEVIDVAVVLNALRALA
jgi:heavy metal translocating P-type ATPase